MAAALLFGIAFLIPQPAFAAGTEFSMRGEDLELRVDTRWTGTAQGGYYPVRVRVVNRGESRNLTFRFVPQESQLPTVERTIGAEQNATVQFTLSIPMVGDTNYGELRVFQGGRRIESFTKQLALPDADGGQFDRPALLVISLTGVDCERFEEGVNVQLPQANAGVYWGRHGHGYGTTRSSDHEVVPPVLLPDSWIDYSGLDLVAVSLDTFGKLPLPNRTAILHWVHAGGTLLVYNVGQPAEQSSELGRLLELNRHSSVSAEWQKADPSQRTVAPRITLDQFGNRIQEAVEAVQQGEFPAGLPPGIVAGGNADAVWAALPDAFVRRDLMLGSVYAFKDNPFPGSASDWHWFLKTMGPRRFQWTARHGISARQPNEEFLDFLIPGIRGVPVYAFVVLISLFAIVIGPLNYLLLWKKKQLSLLVITIPAIAFATSVSLFAYSAVAHGFSIKSRVRSLTVLDQASRTAVTTSRVAFYAGLAPSSGLRFSPETAVYPIWPSSQTFEGGRVDWTETQALEAGWLRSRTHTQFLTVTHRAERGRLEVEPPGGGVMNVSNGLEWNLESLLVADAQGELYFGQEIPAGAAARLKKATPDDLKTVAELAKRHPVRRPDNVAAAQSFRLFDMNWRGYPYATQTMATQFAHNLSEQRIGRFTAATSGDPLSPNSYMAVLKDNPRVETGVDGTDARAGWHMLIGYYQ